MKTQTYNKILFLLVGILIGIIIISLLVFVLSYELPLNKNMRDIEEEHNTIKINLTYQNLTEQEIINFNFIFKNIKEIYLTKNQNIIITKNMSNFCDSCTGLNRGKGREIIIFYRENPFLLKRTICHELLHSYMIRGNESHEIIYDVANYITCFENE